MLSSHGSLLRCRTASASSPMRTILLASPGVVQDHSVSRKLDQLTDQDQQHHHNDHDVRLETLVAIAHCQEKTTPGEPSITTLAIWTKPVFGMEAFEH
jgi:hypothetical protein